MSISLQQQLAHTLQVLNRIVMGKDRQVRLALSCLLANGHLLIEDLPGMGKTTLAHALAKVLGLDYKRVQFTSDLLPADLTGASIFNAQKSEFHFHQGPIFSSLLLADELNRATPKSQSALLEAMEEYQVSIDGHTHALPKPFFVIATQNPQSQTGTFPLPEAQLDRFMFSISLGYPDPAVERQLLDGKKGRALLDKMKPTLNQQSLIHLQNLVMKVSVSEAILDYVQRLIATTRQGDLCHTGLSPRGAQALLKSAKSWALLQGRQHVLPEDIQAVFIPIAAHRLVAKQATQGVSLARHILRSVDAVGAVHA